MISISQKFLTFFHIVNSCQKTTKCSVIEITCPMWHNLIQRSCNPTAMTQNCLFGPSKKPDIQTCCSSILSSDLPLYINISRFSLIFFFTGIPKSMPSMLYFWGEAFSFSFFFWHFSGAAALCYHSTNYKIGEDTIHKNHDGMVLKISNFASVFQNNHFVLWWKHHLGMVSNSPFSPVEPCFPDPKLFSGFLPWTNDSPMWNGLE